MICTQSRSTIRVTISHVILLSDVPVYRVAEVEQKPTDSVQIGRFVACHAIHWKRPIMKKSVGLWPTSATLLYIISLEVGSTK